VPRGDGDGVPEGGEKLNLQLSLRNQASSVLQYVKTKLTTTADNVAIVEPDVVYGYLNPGESSWSGSYFSLELDSTATSGAAFQLRATYGKNNIAYYQDFVFPLTFYPTGALEPRFVVDHVQWNDGNGSGDGDGVLESGEAGTFDVYLKNTGNANATQVKATIRNAPAFIRVRDLTVDYPDLIAGGSSEKGRTGNFFAFDNLVPTTFAGTANADIVILYSGSSQEYVIHDYPLFVVSPAPWIGVQWIGTNPKKLDFGVAPSATNLIFTARVDNYGSADMHVAAISTSAQDTVWIGESLPWTIPPGSFKSFQVTLSTANLQGQIRREVVVSSDGRFYPNPYPDNQPDRIVISGLVGDLPAVYELSTAKGPATADVDVSGNIIVYRDSRYGNNEIFAFDLVKKTETRITANPANKFNPRISGNIIAWADERNWNGQGLVAQKDIYAYDISSNREFVVSTNEARESLVGVNGNFIAYLRLYAETPTPSSSTGYNLYVYDTTTDTTVPITSFQPNNGQPTGTVNRTDMGGGILVWSQFTYVFPGATVSDFGLWKQVTGGAPERILSSPSGLINAPSANSGRIAWATTPPTADYPEIFFWDNGSTRQLTTEQRDHADSVLALGNTFVAYNKFGRPGLYYYDLVRDIEGQLTDKPVVNWLRADANAFVFIATNHIFYTVLNQTDLAVSSDDIGFSNPAPTEGDVLDVSVSIHNLTKLGATSDITVRLYDGDPDFGGVPLRTNGISGGLAAFASVTVPFNSVPVGPAGTHNIFTRLSTAIAENPANNKANKVLEVRAVPQFVSLGEIDPVGFETGSKPAVIAVQRTGATNAALTVNYTISGSASNGVDYAALPGTAIIPAGLASTLIQVIPSDDLLAEGDETVVLTLSTNSAYTIVSPSVATAVIADNDTAITNTNAPSFSGASRLQNGTFRFNLLMERGRIYVVDYSTNLVNWSQLISNTSPFRLFDFIDYGATNDTQRFYRVKNP
jgi:beta propeller repeat protein